MVGSLPKLPLFTPGCASRPTSSWFVIRSAALVDVERGGQNHRQVGMPARLRGPIGEHLARPAIRLAVGGDELSEAVRLPDLLAQLVEHETLQLEQLPVPARVAAGGLEASRPLL